MRIGELSKRTGIAARMLRYYEEQNLITPQRLDNGYRDYGEYLIDRVLKIRGLLDAGIPTRIIVDMLPCLDQSQDVVVHDPDPRLREVLAQERDRMMQRIRILEQNYQALTHYIDAMDRAIDRAVGRAVEGAMDQAMPSPEGAVA